MEDKHEKHCQNAEGRDNEMMTVQLIDMETREHKSNQPWNKSHSEE